MDKILDFNTKCMKKGETMENETIILARKVDRLLGRINFIGNLNSAQQRLIYASIENAKVLLSRIIRKENDKEKKEKIKDIYNLLTKIDEEKNKFKKQILLNNAYSDLIDLFF